jgi:uncharacterized protein YjcR
LSTEKKKDNRSQKIRCKARSKRTGKQCRQWAAVGHLVCYHHGAGGGAPKDNKNAMRYGAYVNKILDEEELVIFKEFYKLMHEDFILNRSSDRMSAELACIYFVKLTRAVNSGNAEAIYKMDLLVRNQLKDLKATKDKREGDTINIKTSPAEWATKLLERVQQANELARKINK